MAITNGYLTLAQFRAEVDYGTGTDDDAGIEVAIEAASRAIDHYTGRYFYSLADKTHYYTPAVTYGLRLGEDLQSVTTLKVDTSGDGTFDTTLAADTDYLLEPFNAASHSHPYHTITLARNTTRYFPTGYRSVELVGTFGWAAVPTAIKQACFIQALKYWKSKDAPLGIVGFNEFSVRKPGGLDGDARQLARPFRLLSPVF